MPHVVVDVDSDIPAERMLAAATDFSERRPEFWPNISREFWQLHDRGPNWAEATEGSPAVWARERYEWSGQPRRRDDAGLERLPARWHVDIDRRAAQRRRQPLRVVLERRFKGKGWLFYPAVALFGRRMFKRNLQKTLNVLGRSGS